MVFFLKKHFVNLLFIIASFITLFEIYLDWWGEGYGFVIYLLSVNIWIITGLLISLHELSDILLDYMNNKNLAKKIILVVKIIAWLGILSFLYMIF